MADPRHETSLTLEYVNSACRMARQQADKTPTKKEVLTEFMQRQGANSSDYMLILPIAAQSVLDKYRGNMPDFAKYSSCADGIYIISKT